MRRTAELLLVAAGVAAIAYGVGSCGKTDAVSAAEQRARDAENGFKAAISALEGRRAHVETVTVRVTTQGQSIDRVVNIVDSVLVDSAATISDLRHTLSLLRTEVVTYRVTVDSLIMSHLAYRQATDHALVMADSTIGQLQGLVAAERKARWKYRGQGLLGGMSVAALIVLLL